MSSGDHDSLLLEWSAAVTAEVRAGLELDATCVGATKDPKRIEAAERAWHASLDRLNEAYGRLSTFGDLDLAMRLVTILTPTGKQAATAGLGRAMAGVTVEAQRLMVRNFPPVICARSAEFLMLVWDQWKETEQAYSAVCGTTDLARRTRYRAEIEHFRKLIPELLYLWSHAEETRALRQAIRYGVSLRHQRCFWDPELYAQWLADYSPGGPDMVPLMVVMSAARFRTACEENRFVKCTSFRGPPLVLRQAAERERAAQ